MLSLGQLKRAMLGSRDRVRLTGRHYRNARQLLLYTVEVLNEAKIDYHVVYGTLLGLARDGDLIPWDTDIDLMIPRASVEAFRKLRWRFQVRGWRFCDRYRLAIDYAAWQRGDVSSFQVKCPLLLDVFRSPILRTGRKMMDVYVRYPDGEHTAWDTFDMVSRTPQRFFDGYETIIYAGREVHVPRDHEQFLALVYGDWRTPNPGYDARRDDGTLLPNAWRSAA